MNLPLNVEQWQNIQLLFEGQRLRRGWTREELARKAGLSRTTLFYLERGGTQQPRLSTLKRLAETLELDFQELMEQSLAARPPADLSPSLDPRDSPVPARSDLRLSPEFDRKTNPVIDQVLAESPALFQEFTSSDWEELYDGMRMDEAISAHGVRDQAVRITRKKQLIRKLEVLLQTHFSEITAALLETLYQQIQASSSHWELNSGCPPALRQPPPGQ